MSGEPRVTVTARWLADHGLRGLSSTPPAPVAVDPPDCGCTECMTGEYVPLSEAKPWHLALLFAGEVRNNTGLTFTALPGEEEGTVRVVPYFESGTPVAESCPDDPRWRLIADGWTLEVEE